MNQSKLVLVFFIIALLIGCRSGQCLASVPAKITGFCGDTSSITGTTEVQWNAMNVRIPRNLPTSDDETNQTNQGDRGSTNPPATTKEAVRDV